jgi:hypothetical protein
LNCKVMDFAVPRKSFHAIRVLDVAVVDVVGTLAIAWAWSAMSGRSLWCTAGVLFALGVVAHRLFGIRTKVDTMLFA